MCISDIPHAIGGSRSVAGPLTSCEILGMIDFLSAIKSHILDIYLCL